MKVFISWSKEGSKECAEILRDWIKCTLQASEPWISSKDLDKGSLWFTEINDQFKDTKVGIVCLTKENKNNPWILFEAGALAKGLSTNRVCTFLLDLEPTDLQNPLAQFNHTLPNEEGMKSLLITINSELAEKKLDDRILDQVFQTYWPIFEKKFKDLKLNNNKPESEKDSVRSSDDILKEILNTTRTLDKRIRNLEINNDKSFRTSISKNELYEKVMILINQNLHPKDIEIELSNNYPREIIRMAINDLLNNDNFIKNNNLRNKHSSD
jgi:hypothetical protein